MKGVLAIITCAVALGACGYPALPRVDDRPPADAGVDTGPLAQNCSTYCSEIATACTGANAQYPAQMNCAMTCARFAPGQPTDMSGDTLGCRLWHIQNITVRAGSPAVHCPHAGPAGAPLAAATGVCGAGPCEDFCKLVVSVCGTVDAPVAGVDPGNCNPNGTSSCLYQNLGDCLSRCAAFPRTSEYSASTTTGDTLACRLYHITNAAVSAANAVTHCRHTGPSPTQACM